METCECEVCGANVQVSEEPIITNNGIVLTDYYCICPECEFKDILSWPNQG